MRIISQDGTLDLPYERFVISVNMQNQGEIIAWTGNHISDDECIVMAVYSSFAKAQKAMEMLRDAYNNYDFCINLTTENILKSYANSRPKEEFMKYAYPYFKFPQDEDVEV